MYNVIFFLDKKYFRDHDAARLRDGSEGCGLPSGVRR
jgi:hypothetical protein